RVYPDDAKAHNNLGSLYLAQGDLERAEALLNAALRINADFPEAEYNLGAVALRRKDFASARAHFERALKLNPRYEAAQAALSFLRSESRPQTEGRGMAVEGTPAIEN